MIQRAFDLARLGAKVARPETMRTPEEVLPAVVKALRRRRVPFLIHGAWALAAYGFARATEDFDFLILLDERNVRRLERAMADLHAVRVAPGSAVHVMFNAYGWRLDFFLEPPRGFVALQRRGVRRRFLRMVLPVIAKADLVRRKRARGTLQDRADIERLLGA